MSETRQQLKPAKPEPMTSRVRSEPNFGGSALGMLDNMFCRLLISLIAEWLVFSGHPVRHGQMSTVTTTGSKYVRGNLRLIWTVVAQFELAE